MLRAAHIKFQYDSLQIELEFGNVGFGERGKPDYPEQNLSEQGREPTTNSVKFRECECSLAFRELHLSQLFKVQGSLMYPVGKFARIINFDGAKLMVDR